MVYPRRAAAISCPDTLSMATKDVNKAGIEMTAPVSRDYYQYNIMLERTLVRMWQGRRIAYCIKNQF